MPGESTAGPWSSRIAPVAPCFPRRSTTSTRCGGESENRNKELKTELLADRLGDHQFMANFFRLCLHTAALNLLVRLRQTVVQSDPTSAELKLPADFPTEAIGGAWRKQFFSRRREL